MTDHLELTRRKLLGALGTVGLASGGAGLGTSAYLNDEEAITGNEVVAGQLDLKVDWQEHYYDARGRDAHLDGVRPLVGDAALRDGEYGVPWPDDPVVAAVSDRALLRLMRATQVDAWPDANDDGSRDTIKTRGQLASEHPLKSPEEIERLFREQFADVSEAFSGRKPLIYLDDVKPGDWGEVTFSVHLFDNPAYLWLTGGLRAGSENRTPESEADSTREEAGVVELLDRVRVAVWHDDGDNVAEGEEWVESPHAYGSDTSISLTREQATVFRGSLRTFLALLEAGIPLSRTGGFESVVPGGGGDGAFVPHPDNPFPDNPTCADIGMLEAHKFDPVSPGENAYETEFGTVTVTVSDDLKTVTAVEADFPVTGLIVKGGPGANVYVSAEGVTHVTGLDFQSPLVGKQNQNVPEISHVDVCYSGEPGDGGDGHRKCFPNSTTRYLGFAWWLPPEVGNEVQTDSVRFDLGFYAEQCRHNDGEATRPGDDTGDE